MSQVCIPRRAVWNRSKERIEAEAREAIALTLDVEPESFTVRVEPKLPEDVSALVAAVAAARAVTENARVKEREAAHEAAKALVVDLGLPQRDAGKILGVTHQRVQQILSGTRR